MIDRLITEHTTGTIVQADGTIIGLPVRLLTPVEATLLRTYFVWAIREQLEPELICGTCFDHSRESKAIYNITETDIQIVCGCQIRAFFGATQPVIALPPSRVVPTDEGGPADVYLSPAAATVLRDYKAQVLERLDLKEMLRCNACYELNQPDGCLASVRTRSIEIRCRCSRRIFVGTEATPV